MSNSTRERIAFDVETSRVLQILASEIYDSPNAFLRENLQNAYDAVLMRSTAQGTSLAERRIEVTILDHTLTVRDDGIGMTEDVLKNNFWKAGSSGKKSELARRSGVIGTFGIGAMANFGVCQSLRVETRHIDSDTTLISSARREDLHIAKECIDLERSAADRDAGTSITAELDLAFTIDLNAVKRYLSPYVRFLPVPVFVNEELISQISFDAALGDRAEGFVRQSLSNVSTGEMAGVLETLLNSQGRLLIRLTEITLSGHPAPVRSSSSKTGAKRSAVAISLAWRRCRWPALTTSAALLISTLFTRQQVAKPSAVKLFSSFRVWLRW